MKKIWFVFSVVAAVTVLVMGASRSAHAATYYVNAAAANDSGSGSLSSPKKYISSGIALMSTTGGDILIIASGTYGNALDTITSVRNGTAGRYNTIKADVDGGVVITRGFDVPSSAQYLRFEGLKWDTTGTSFGKSIKGHHIKFLRCAFKGGPATGNTTNLSVGTNDRTPGAQYILLEDVWAYGLGGRYNIIVYNSDKVIVRRAVVRHDGGWTNTSGDPEAGITVYNSSDTLVQNSIVLDSNLTYSNWEKAFYNVKNGSSTNPHSNGVIVGSIALNNVGYAYGYDDVGPIQNASISNSVAWASGGGVAIGGGTGGGHAVAVTGMTVGNTAGHAFANWGNGGSTLSVAHSIAYANTGNAFLNVGAHSYNSCNGNGTNCSGTGEVSYSPLANGLRYLPRIETGTTLKTGGQGAAQIGAELVKRIGVSGTLHGESGYDSVTDEDLWPWPNEARIRADMSDVASVGTRGFCAGSQTLTQYIWGHLGQPLPTLPLAAPVDVRVRPAL